MPAAISNAKPAGTWRGVPACGRSDGAEARSWKGLKKSGQTPGNASSLEACRAARRAKLEALNSRNKLKCLAGDNCWKLLKSGESGVEEELRAGRGMEKGNINICETN